MLLFLSGSMLGSRSVFFLCIIVIVIVVFFFLKCGDLRFCDLLGRAAGLFGTGSSGAADSSKAEAKQDSAADGLATVPDLVGKTEEEAKTLANDAHLGVQMAGEEASGKRQDLPSGDSCGNTG